MRKYDPYLKFTYTKLSDLIFWYQREDQGQEFKPEPVPSRWLIRDDGEGGLIATQANAANGRFADIVMPIERGKPFFNIPYASLRDGMVFDQDKDGNLTEVDEETLIAEIDQMVRDLENE